MIILKNKGWLIYLFGVGWSIQPFFEVNVSIKMTKNL